MSLWQTLQDYPNLVLRLHKQSIKENKNGYNHLFGRFNYVAGASYLLLGVQFYHALITATDATVQRDNGGWNNNIKQTYQKYRLHFISQPSAETLGTNKMETCLYLYLIALFAPLGKKVLQMFWSRNKKRKETSCDNVNYIEVRSYSHRFFLNLANQKVQHIHMLKERTKYYLFQQYVIIARLRHNKKCFQLEKKNLKITFNSLLCRSCLLQVLKNSFKKGAARNIL